MCQTFVAVGLKDELFKEYYTRKRGKGLAQWFDDGARFVIGHTVCLVATRSAPSRYNKT